MGVKKKKKKKRFNLTSVVYLEFLWSALIDSNCRWVLKLPSTIRAGLLSSYHLIVSTQDTESTLMNTVLGIKHNVNLSVSVLFSNTHTHTHTHTIHTLHTRRSLYKYQQTADIALCWPTSDGIIFKGREGGKKSNGKVGEKGARKGGEKRFSWGKGSNWPVFLYLREWELLLLCR